MLKRKYLIIISVLSTVLCFFNSSTLFANEEEAISYLLKGESKSSEYDLYLNGFLLSSNQKICSNWVRCFLKSGKNRIIVNVDGETVDKPQIVNVEIVKVTKIGKNSTDTDNVVLSWNIKLEKDKSDYKKEFELKTLKKPLPWEKADKVCNLTADDIKRIKSMTFCYKNTMKGGNKEQIKKMLATDCRYRMEAEAMFSGRSEEFMIKQFMTFYDILFAPSLRGDVYEYEIGELDVFKSPYSDRIVIVKTKNQKPIIKIETPPDEEGEKTSSGLSKSVLYFIKVNGKWYIY